MKRFDSIGRAAGRIAAPVLTVGIFDGVHRGHQAIIERLNALAAARGGSSTLLSFSPHPRAVLQQDSALKLITTADEKATLLEHYGLENLIVHPFTPAFARMESTVFVRDFLVRALGVKVLVIGYDHHFGRDRAGGLAELEALSASQGFVVEELPAQSLDGVSVSSTVVRQALTRGDVVRANRFLGYDYFLGGTVVRGDGLGKELGFPTANLRIPVDKLMPAVGTYAVRVVHGEKTYGGMANIGYRPTVDGRDLRTEVHLFDFAALIYGQSLQVHFISRLRDELRFESRAQLVKQLELDRKRALALL